MAHSLRTLRLPRPHIGINPGHAARMARERAEAIEHAWRDNPRRVLWLALWFPFWIGGDAPRPSLPGARVPGTLEAPPTAAGAWLAGRIGRVTRHFRFAWTTGAILRGLTLALLLLSAWALLAILGPAPLPAWPVVIVVLVTGALVGGMYGWLVRPHHLLVAHMLDHTFGLNERVITAFDRQADTSYVSRLQLADAANTLEEVLAEIPRTTFLPIREAGMCLIALGALVTTLLANVPQEPIDPSGPSPIAAFVPASERLAVRERPVSQQPAEDQPQPEQESLAEMQEQARAAETAREDLATIGEALEAHPITQPAADSIAGGDYDAAAESLRSAAQSASGLSQAERDSLADNLDAAADEIEESNPELAQAARDAADALREGGPAAEEALNELADQIEGTGSQAQTPGSGSPNLDESQPGASDGTTEGEQGGESGSGEGSESGANQQEPGEGASTDPGEGVDAAPGVTNGEQEQAPGSSSQEGDQGGANEGSGSSSENGGDEPQDGGGSGGANEEGSSSADGGASADKQETTGAPDEENEASQGSGAGTGQSNANDQSGSDSAVDSSSESEGADPDAEVPNEGQAGDPPPSRSDRGEEDDNTGSSSGGSTSLELEGTSDENVPAGGTSGTASQGSGSGSSTSSGDQGQGEVGVAGPDSNRVPDALRDVVQDFFDEQRP